MTTEQLRAFIVANEGRAMFNIKHKMYDAALVECDNNITKAAELLGVSVSSVRIYVSRYIKGLGFGL